MKKEYTITLRCATCGSEDHFEFNDDKSYVKCTLCGREYTKGLDELVKLNSEEINSTQDKIMADVTSEIIDSMREALKGSKFIKIK